MRKKILSILNERYGQFVSGQEIADTLNVSRANISKHIRNLRQEGYHIEAVPNKGYMLTNENDLLTKELIEDGLDDFFTIEVVDEIDSTNNYCKLNSAQLQDGYVLVADTQSGGRGRNGRSFYSPKQTGIYFTIFLRPKVAIDLALKLTAAAGTVVAEAIEKNYPLKAEIKWVNDVLVNQKKVTGILCEAGFEMNTANLDYMIVGIGINVHPRTFPDDIENIAGSIEDFTNLKVSRNVLLKDVLNIFLDFYRNIDANSFLKSYRSHSCLIGKEVTVIEASKTYRAKVIDIDQNANLVVEKDGIRSVLSSGEIHIRDYY